MHNASPLVADPGTVLAIDLGTGGPKTALHTLQNTETLKELIQQDTQLTIEVRQLAQELHHHIMTSSA